jgi:hypothetical protein
LKIIFDSENEKKTFTELLDITDKTMAEYLSATVNSLYYYELLGGLKESFKEGKVKKRLNNFSIIRLLGIT